MTSKAVTIRLALAERQDDLRFNYSTSVIQPSFRPVKTRAYTTSKDTDAIYFCGDNVSDCAAASRITACHASPMSSTAMHVTDPLVRGLQLRSTQLIIAEISSVGPSSPVAGQSQMNSAKCAS